MGKILHGNIKYQKAFVAILTPNIIDLKTKNITTRKKFGHFKMGKNQFIPKTKQSKMYTHRISFKINEAKIGRLKGKVD